MQLILLIALFLAYGNGGDNFYKEVKPFLETVGGDDIKNAIKSAEEFKGVLAALGSIGSVGKNGAAQGEAFCEGEKTDGAFSSANPRSDKNTRTYASTNQCSNNKTQAHGNNPPQKEECEEYGAAPPFAIAPVVRIADREIVYRLAQFFSDDAYKV